MLGTYLGYKLGKASGDKNNGHGEPDPVFEAILIILGLVVLGLIALFL